ncbi:hypothetical protein ACOMHN_018859 [Nucella lapillus]
MGYEQVGHDETYRCGLRGSEECSRSSGGGNDHFKGKQHVCVVWAVESPIQAASQSISPNPLDNPPHGKGLVPGPPWVGPRHDFSREALVQPVLVQAAAGARGGLTS